MSGERVERVTRPDGSLIETTFDRTGRAISVGVPRDQWPPPSPGPVKPSEPPPDPPRWKTDPYPIRSPYIGKEWLHRQFDVPDGNDDDRAPGGRYPRAVIRDAIAAAIACGDLPCRDSNNVHILDLAAWRDANFPAERFDSDAEDHVLALRGENAADMPGDQPPAEPPLSPSVADGPVLPGPVVEDRWVALANRMLEKFSTARVKGRVIEWLTEQFSAGGKVTKPEAEAIWQLWAPAEWKRPGNRP